MTFAQASAEVPLAPGQSETFELPDPSLQVEPGQYDLTAFLRSNPGPPVVRQPVTVADQ